MNHVERFNALMNFEAVDRLPRIEWAGYWNLTTDRWKAEGLDIEGGAPVIRESLGLDPYRQMWRGALGRECPKPVSHGAGIMKTEAEYDALDLYPAWDKEEALRYRDNLPENAVTWITMEGFFWFPRRLFGIEPHLYAFYDEPDLMHRINRELTAYNLNWLDEYCDWVGTPQFMTFAEDMSYNHGPMCSKETFDDFLAPYYRQIVPALKDRGIRVFVDSDGDVEPLIPWLKEVGVDGILPLERMAGVDVGSIRSEHPDWLMIGAYDKTVMKDGETAMRAEFERLLPTMKTGGFIPSVDHQTPPDVSLENYHCYLRLLEEYTSMGGGLGEKILKR
jgi:hypothetical protein